MSSRRDHAHRVALDPVTREYLEGQFQRKFYEAAVSQEPDNLECLLQLGDVYTRQGQYEKGLAIDLRLVGLCPEEPTFHYNLACSHALLGEAAACVTALREAIRLGFPDIDHLEEDEYLENVRNTPEFRQLVAEFCH